MTRYEPIASPFLRWTVYALFAGSFAMLVLLVVAL